MISTINMHKLLFVLTISLIGILQASASEEKRHITESPVCQKLIAEFSAPTPEKKRAGHLSDVRRSVNSTKGKYTDAKKVKALAELEGCVDFLSDWSYYPQNLIEAKANGIFEKIDTTKNLPNKNVINKALSPLEIKKLT